MISTPISGSIHERNTNGTQFLTPPTSSPSYLRCVLRIIHWIRDDAQQFLRHVRSFMYTRVDYVEFAQFRICDIFDVGRVYTRDYLQAYSKLSARLKLFISFKSQTVKRFERANIKRFKTKRISIMRVWLLMLLIMNIIIWLETQFG